MSVALAFCGGEKGCFERFEKGCKTSEFRDKIAKLVVATSGLTEKICRLQGQDLAADRVHNLTEVTKGARDVFGLWNVFGGVITGVKKGFKTTYTLIRSDRAVALEGQGLLSRVPQGKCAERALAVGEVVGKLIGGITYIFAFGVQKPIRFVGKMGAELGKTTKAVVKAFAAVMFVNHIGGLIAKITGWVRKSIALERLRKNEGLEKDLLAIQQSRVAKGFAVSIDKEVRGRALADLEQQYVTESWQHGIGIAETAIDLTLDSARVFRAPIPILAQAIMEVVGGVLGLSRVFLNTYESADPLAA